MREPAWIDGLQDFAAFAISVGAPWKTDPTQLKIHIAGKREYMKPIWIVDDDASIRWVLEKALARENLATRSFSNARDAMAALETETPQVLVSDIRMPGESGLDLLSAVKARYPGLPVIIITAFSDLDSAVAAFQGGAFEYLAKPFDIDKAVELIRRALEESLRETSVESGPTETPEILGQAPAMQEVFRAIGRLSQSNVTVLITGESGTGKELVARALHKHSPRAQQPFIALNTAAIPKDLLESELFGHERGAFTGAQTTRRGRFEQAEGGTLFLDEIGDMPFDLQTRLLRVLSDGHFYRVGGHQPMKANVRVITATHQNLEQRVREGLFREDLYHRLNVIRLRLPSLRERREDIPLLVRHFLVQSARELGVEAKRMSDGALQFLSGLDLPGNVRQLENLCNWITVMAPGQTVDINDLPLELTQTQDGFDPALVPMSAPMQAPGFAPGFAPAAAEFGGAQRVSHPGGHVTHLAPSNLADGGRADGSAVGWIGLLEMQAASMLSAGQSEVMDVLGRQFESALIKTALKHTHGRKNDAAVRLGIGRNTITRKIAELGIDGAKDE
jgi:two-component system nitrogen regulation response regulator GlnG